MQAHVECGKELPPPTCRHFARRGECVFGEKCAYAHPEEVGRFARLAFEEKMRKAESKGKIQNRGKGKRNKVRNRSRAGVFRRFLLDTFGETLLLSGTGVLDVAGGKGDLSFQLMNLNNIRSTIVDPRQVYLDTVVRQYRTGMFHRNAIFAKYTHSSCTDPLKTPLHRPFHLRSFFKTSLEEGGIPQFVSSPAEFVVAINEAKAVLWTHKGLAQTNLTTEEEESSPNMEVVESGLLTKDTPSLGVLSALGINAEDNHCRVVEDYDAAFDIVENCSVVVGMHPDQAAGFIVDFAISYGKPFAIVPCCVYKDEFPTRKLRDGKQVRNYDDLLAFLKSKHPDIIEKALDMEGKNKVKYALYLHDMDPFLHPAPRRFHFVCQKVLFWKPPQSGNQDPVHC
jgi:hypothetical protein